jgi:hypothetical protein
MAAVDYNATWVQLKEGLTLLVRIIQKVVTDKKITVVEYMDYYNKVFKVCTDSRDDLKDNLYRNLSELLADIVGQEEVALRGKSDLTLLLDYLDRFGNYSAATKMIRNIFRYMVTRKKSMFKTLSYTQS